MLKNLASRPGLQSSEWYVAAITAILNLINASTHWVSYQQAIPPTVAAVAYVLSRGLAKYEPRYTGQNPPA